MIELVGPFFGESAEAKREREVQEYQQRELIHAKDLLAQCEGILKARIETAARHDEAAWALPIEREMLPQLTEFRRRSLFPPREGGE